LKSLILAHWEQPVYSRDSPHWSQTGSEGLRQCFRTAMGRLPLSPALFWKRNSTFRAWIHLKAERKGREPCDSHENRNRERGNRKGKAKEKLSLCLNMHHTTKTLRGSGGVAPRSLNLGTRWRWAVTFTPRPLYPKGKHPWDPLHRKVGRLQSQPVWFKWRRE